ncbi:hypothetical protein [Dyadobacter sp. BHUBP1]|uniref:hypothetical protein n=1 Tax=Dyadobacter sp. BHUBP1 TaxID=3424178 RepID=UPI003D34D73B
MKTLYCLLLATGIAVIRVQYNPEGLPERRNTFVRQFLDLPAVLSETLFFEYERY